LSDLKQSDSAASDYVYKRYIWCIDMGEIIDMASCKPVTAAKLRERLINEGNPLADAAKWADFISMLKDLGQNMLDIRRAFKQAKKVKSEEVSTKALVDAAYTELRPRFQLYNQPQSGAVIYHYRDTNGEIHTLQKEKVDGFTAAIREYPQLLDSIEAVYNLPEYEALRATLTMSGFIAQIYDRYLYDQTKLVRQDPTAISWDPKVFALKQLDATMLQQGPHPAWDEFLNRLDHPEVFKAWVWAVFEPTNTGRQAMFLYGAGFDGKSSVIKAISSLLGKRLTMSVDNDKLKNTQFFYGNIHGRRLVLYPDCKVSNVLRYETVQSMLGNDEVQVNKKNKEAFNAVVYVRFIIGSNKYPKIDPNARAELSRLLFIKVAPINKDSLGDSKFESRLKSELGPFLWACRESYAALCPSNMEIAMPPAMLDTIRSECAGSEADTLEEFIDERLVFDAAASTPKAEVKGALKQVFMDNFNARDAENAFDTLCVTLSARGVKSAKMTLTSGKRTMCFVGVRLKAQKSAI
jgi:hypothetical protein